MINHPRTPWALAAALWLSVASAAAQGTGAEVPAASIPTPDNALRQWRDANDLVGRFKRGHVDLLRWEEAQRQGQESPQPSTAPSASPGASAVPDGSSLELLRPEQAVQRAFLRRPDLMTEASSSSAEQMAANQRLASAAHEVSRAWLQAVSAQAQAERAQVQLEVVQTGYELAQRMVAVGNWPRLRGIEQQLQLAQAQRQATDAALAKAGGFEQLARSVVWAGELAKLRLPAALPEVPSPPGNTELPTLLAQALAAHPGWQAKSVEWQREQDRADPRAVQALEARQAAAWQAAWAGANGQQIPAQAPRLTPAPDHRTEAAAKARAEQAQWQVQMTTQVRSALAQAHAAQARLAHWRQVLPTQQAWFDEMQLRHNGMFISTWDMLQARLQVLQAEMSLHDAWRDAWAAHFDLQAVLSGVDVPLSATPAANGRPGGAPSGGAAPH
jgi:outer membrane protein TolC